MLPVFCRRGRHARVRTRIFGMGSPDAVAGAKGGGTVSYATLIIMCLAGLGVYGLTATSSPAPAHKHSTAVHAITLPPSPREVAPANADGQPLVLSPSSSSSSSSSAASASPGGPLVGVCIVGGVRALAGSWDSVWAQGIESLQPDPTRRRVVFETTFATSDCDSNPVNAGPVSQKCKRSVKDSIAFLNSSEGSGHPTRKFDLHVDDTLTNCDHPLAAKHECCRHGGTQRMEDPPRGIWGLKQYLRKVQCSERLKRIENETGAAFDVVLWIRPDIYLFDALPGATEIARERHPRVLVSSKEGGQPMGDYIFIAPRPLAWPWAAAMFDAHGVRQCDPRGSHDIPEMKFEQETNRRQIPFQTFPFMFAILRSKKSADCFRLRNEVFAKASVRDPDKLSHGHDVLISPFQLCANRFPGGDENEGAPSEEEKKKPAGDGGDTATVVGPGARRRRGGLGGR